MRTILILVFAAACVWLITERIRLTEQVTSMEEQLKKKQDELDENSKQLQAGGYRPATGTSNGSLGSKPIAPPPKAGWINEHVEKGARSLDAPKQGR